jgi:hypothetical protein
VAEQKLDLFEFGAPYVAEAGATATKVMRCQIVYADPLGTSFDCIPDHVGIDAGFLARSILQNPSEYLSLPHTRMAEPNIHKALAPSWHRYCSQPSAFANQIDNDPVALP